MPPTGIAAANIEVKGTDVCATTLHNMFDMDGECTSGLDVSKLQNSKVAALMLMEVFLIDEVSMMDMDCFFCIQWVLSTIDHSRRSNAPADDVFGQLHMLLFGDFKRPAVRATCSTAKHVGIR